MAQLAGETILASDIKVIKTRQKAVSESVTSSTTMQNDNDFVIALEAGKTYDITLWLHVTGNTTNDIKVSWVTTGTITSNSRSVFGPSAGTTDVGNGNYFGSAWPLTTVLTYGLDAVNTAVIKEELSVTCTVAGNLTLQWAQSSSNATATTCSTSSRIRVMEMETF
jgi:hypothetical protein